MRSLFTSHQTGRRTHTNASTACAFACFNYTVFVCLSLIQKYEGGQEDDYMYENQREGSGEARETARGGADDAMEGRRAVEGGGPGDATEGGEGGRRRRGKRKVGDG